ncbi:MAG: multiheme c-type cytochrome [Myxococcota bacterium]
MPTDPSPIPVRGVRWVIVWAAVLLSGGFSGAGCSDPAPPAAEASESQSHESSRGTPLPRFEGSTFDGGSAGTDLFARRRGIVYVFASTDKEADAVARILERLEKPAAASNAVILGVNRDGDPEAGDRFVRKHGFEFPVVLDEEFSISRKLRVPPGTSAVVVVDSEGYVIGGFAGLRGDFPDPDVVYEREVRRLLRLEEDDGVSPSFGLLPDAPDFRVVSFAGDALTLESLRGRVVILILFLPTCPHCHEALQFLKKLVKDLDDDDLVIVPVSTLDRRYLVEDMLEQQDLELTVYLDPDSALQKAYAHSYAVPDTVVIDRDGRVFARHAGFSDRIQALVTMEVRQTLGIKNVLLLDKKGYSGDETCRICHTGQHETWSLTSHAYAFDTLVEHGADRDSECLPCHTVGWGRPGGYSLELPAEHLQNVQCENCHGRGGPHQSPDFLKAGFEPVCASCHNTKHSLNFVFAERLPLISHAANQQFTSLSAEERRALIAARDRRKRTLFANARFVGSEDCRSCHPAQYRVWSESAHAHAFRTLEKRGESGSTECQNCHTTGFGEAGGFPEGGEGLVNVGCESCHGPGGNHVEEGAKKPGTILALADKCDSCVLLQICGSCHDEANDPGFEFELLDKLELIRHATATVSSVEP